MIAVMLPGLGFAPVWRDAARRLAGHAIASEDVVWRRDGTGDLFSGGAVPEAAGARAVTAPRGLAGLLETALCHREPEAPSLAYQMLLRHQRDRGAWQNPADPLRRRVDVLAKAVRRDVHKMHAFVRFRELPGSGSRSGARRRFGAWFEPDHLSLEAGAPFFARRFADMDWMICTPQGVARFEAGALRYGPPAPRPDLPEDASEALWGTYFASIFNPARIKVKAMAAEMPRKYWKNLPETRLIPGMLEAAEARVAAMRAAVPRAPPPRAARVLDRLAPAPAAAVPGSMAEAEEAARGCRRCDLCHAATQTVWGEGDAGAALMIVGEQPGDREDLTGRPFAGPAGEVLREAMAEAGIGPVWLTNAVKHFKFAPRGKRRLHRTPSPREVEHCRWWLDLERGFVRPKMTLALGASAAFALTGAEGPLAGRRGREEPARDGGPIRVTWHPSYVLRLSGAAARRARDDLVSDLAAAQAACDALRSSS